MGDRDAMDMPSLATEGAGVAGGLFPPMCTPLVDVDLVVTGSGLAKTEGSLETSAASSAVDGSVKPTWLWV